MRCILPIGLLALVSGPFSRFDRKYVLQQKLSSELLNPAHGVGVGSWVEVAAVEPPDVGSKNAAPVQSHFKYVIWSLEIHSQRYMILAHTFLANGLTSLQPFLIGKRTPAYY